jgi:ATP-dependent DNA helicase RecQ
MLLPHLTLVVSPLLSLMKDQLDFLQSKNIPAARLDSTLERDKYNQILQKAKKGELKILMISVERFKNERFRSHLAQMSISLMVVDEAHCISEWGHNFRPEYLKIPTYKKEFKIPQILLLTATATKEVVDDMSRKLNIKIEDFVITGFYRKNLTLQITSVPEAEKKRVLLDCINRAPEASTIVYVTLQKTAEDVANFLSENKICACAYHAGMQSDERELIQNKFMNSAVHCIVATIAFGMGIDKKDIRRVIHYDMPKSIESYSQEIGRSGRDGEKSFCEVLANRDNINILENFVYGDTPEKESIHRLMDKIVNTEDSLFKVKILSLSHDLNIRLLPLKTLLVYLDMEQIISSKYSYFEEYTFKHLKDQDFIINQFTGERQNFVEKIFESCKTKKTRTHVDIPSIVASYNAERTRIITALEYFNEQGWIEMDSKIAVEVYQINNKDINTKEIAERMHALFVEKEKHDIDRIHNMILFFESSTCLSKNLANYFNETLPFEKCGHCSVCNKGKSTIQKSITLKPLEDFCCSDISTEFEISTEDQFSVLNLTKFLCGITTPLSTKLRLRKLKYFGVFEKYSFSEVRGWIEENYQ